MSNTNPAGQPPVSKGLIAAVLCVIALGIGIFVYSRVQASDPTLTAAPPPKAGAQGPVYTPDQQAAIAAKRENVKAYLARVQGGSATPPPASVSH